MKKWKRKNKDDGNKDEDEDDYDDNDENHYSFASHHLRNDDHASRWTWRCWNEVKRMKVATAIAVKWQRIDTTPYDTLASLDHYRIK